MGLYVHAMYPHVRDWENNKWLTMLMGIQRSVKLECSNKLIDYFVQATK